jgi:predicted DNA-binding transcriptional regulator AlpA
MTRKLLKTDEAAERARKPASTLRYYRHLGVGPPSVKIGRSVYYDAAELDAWIEQHFEAREASSSAPGQ